MNYKRSLGIVVVVVGIVLIVVSLIIHSRIGEGRIEISNAQEKVDRGNSFFSATPLTKRVGRQMTHSAQSQINSGNEEITFYSQLYHWFLYGGIVLIVAGGAIFYFGKKKN